MSNAVEEKETDIFEGVEVSKDQTVKDDVPEDDVPCITSVEWNEYVMSLFDSTELVDGNTDKPKPLVAGLRRVAELLLGKIIQSGPTQVFPATSIDHPGRATVVFSVQFQDGSCYSDVADCWEGNTDDIFVVYATATASTRAEARALRKALRLRTVSAEEVTSKDTAGIAKKASKTNFSKKPQDGEYREDSGMSEKQDSFISTLCERADVDKEKLANVVFGFKDYGKVPKKAASEFIDKLNAYIGENEEVPQEIRN